MLNILLTTLPIYFLMLLGYVATRTGLVPVDARKMLAVFVVNIAAPAMILRSVGQQSLADVLDVGILGTYALASVLTFVLVFFTVRKLQGKSSAESSLLGMGGSFSNSMMVSFPLASVFFGDMAVAMLALTLLVENFILFPLTLVLADSGLDANTSKWDALSTSFKRILSNPIIIAIFCGSLLSVSGWSLPGPIDDGLRLLGGALAPIGLFVIGAMMVGYKGQASEQRGINVAIAAKLIVHPLILLVCLLAFGVTTSPLFAVAMMFAATPTFGAYAAIAERYHCGQMCSALVVQATLLSVVTLTLWVWGLSMFGLIAP